MENKEVKETKVKTTKKSDKLEKLQSEYDLLNEKFLRTIAEMQNIKRRSEEEVSKLRRYEGEDLILKLLDITDDFERAISIKVENTEIKKYLDGFEMIYAALINILTTYKVEEIKCLNEPYDANIAQAVLIEQMDNILPGVVIDILQKGYTYNGKVIRPAMVKVSE